MQSIFNFQPTLLSTTSSPAHFQTALLRFSGLSVPKRDGSLHLGIQAPHAWCRCGTIKRTVQWTNLAFSKLLCLNCDSRPLVGTNFLVVQESRSLDKASKRASCLLEVSPDPSKCTRWASHLSSYRWVLRPSLKPLVSPVRLVLQLILLLLCESYRAHLLWYRMLLLF